MPRFKKVRGPTSESVFERFDPLIGAADRGRALAVEASARLEDKRSAGLRREQARLAYKHGPGSEPARRAEARIQAHQASMAALRSEVARVRIGTVKAGPNAVVIHGRVLDSMREPLADLTVGLADDGGQILLPSKTDETGYFKIDSSSARTGKGATRFTPAMLSRDPTGGPEVRVAAEPRAALRLVVLDGKRELHREEMDELLPGEARYREIVVKARR